MIVRLTSIAKKKLIELLHFKTVLFSVEGCNGLKYQLHLTTKKSP